MFTKRNFSRQSRSFVWIHLKQQRKRHYIISLTDGATNFSSGLKERHISQSYNKCVYYNVNGGSLWGKFITRTSHSVIEWIIITQSCVMSTRATMSCKRFVLYWHISFYKSCKHFNITFPQWQHKRETA